MAALLFTFAPFHFSRLFYGHDFYTWYVGIPLFFYYGKNLFFHGRTHWDLRRPARLISLLCVVAILSSFGVYYAFFGSIVLMTCGAASSFKAATMRPLMNATLFCALIFSGVALNLLPDIAYRETHPINHEVAERSPVATEMNALKIMHLLLPQPDHRIGALKAYTKKYDTTFPLSNTTSSLGVVGIVGFLAIILSAGAGLVGRPVQPKLGLVAIVVLSLLLISTVGGFNVLFVTLVTPLIRGWDRISVFIEFGSILAFALLIDGCKRLNASGPAASLVAALVAVVGFLDQTPTSYSATVEPAFAFASTDEAFIRQIESSMPPKSAIYQLPYVAFPESGPTQQLSVYQLGTGFFNSRTLRWSFGGMKGREGDLFYRALSKEPSAKQLDVIEKLGFSGIYIDRRGYADRGASVIADFSQLLGAAPALERPDGDVVFFKVPVHAAEPPDGMVAADLMARAGYFADQFGVRSTATMEEGIDFSSSANLPRFVSDMTGLSGAEPNGRWSDGSVAKSVVISFAKPLPDRFLIELTGVPFGPNAGKKLEMVVGSVKKQIDMPGPFTAQIPIELNGEKVSAIEFVPPSPTSPAELGMGGGDARKLAVAFKVLKITTE
jgi:phosphoglycerol transferase